MLFGLSTELWKCSSQHASKAGTGLRLANMVTSGWRVQLPTTAFGVCSATCLLTAGVHPTEARRWASAAQRN